VFRELIYPRVQINTRLAWSKIRDSPTAATPAPHFLPAARHVLRI